MFEPNSSPEEFLVNISLIDDAINEVSEGFWLLIEFDETELDDTNVTLVRDGLALITIEDNDRKFK